MVVTLGYQCLSCAVVSPGDDTTNNVVEHNCPLQEAKADQLLKAAMEGRPLLVEEESNTESSTLSTPATTKLVLDRLNVTRR